MNPTTPVVILGIHYGSLGIARSLGRMRVPVYGVDGELRSNAFASRYFRGRHQWDFARASPHSSVDFLLGLRATLGRNAVLIPTTDVTAQLVADCAAELGDSYRFQDNASALVRQLCRKPELHALARRHGVPSPETLLPRSVQDAQIFADRVKFPLVLKASNGAGLDASAGRRMVIVRTREELIENYPSRKNPAEPDLMLQEYIPGGDDTIWMFNGYFDRKSECVAGFTGKKLRQYPIHTGATSLGISLHNQIVHELTTNFMNRLGYRGIIDIGYRYDARDGLYKLLDVNPRIGATFRLFVGADGTDVARLLYLDLTSQPLPTITPVYGRKWLDENRDFFASRQYREEGSLTMAAWIGSFRGVHEAAWFAWDDLIPALLTAFGMLRRACRYIWKPAERLPSRA